MSTTGRSGRTPRFSAYSSQFPEDTQAFVFAQFACQAGSPDQAANGAVAFAELFTGAHQPDVLDRGRFTDTAGAHNVVWLAYWFDPEGYDRWQRSDRVRSAWEQLPSDGPVGHWREVCVIPVERNETLHTHRRADCTTSGLSQHEAVELPETQVHDYWGAARDRIADSAVDPFEPALPVFEPQTALGCDTLGRRITVEVPGNVTLIRTAQDWSAGTLYL